MEELDITEDVLLKFGFKNKGIFLDGKYLSPPDDRGFFDKSIEYSLNETEAMVLFKEGKFYYIIDRNDDDYGSNYTYRKIRNVKHLIDLHLALENKLISLPK
jgi:hypothetical protein